MSRVTIDDCLKKVENRFQLVVLSSRRARQLAIGDQPRIETNANKPTIIALMEIANSAITPEEIRTINIKPQVVVDDFLPLDVNLDE